MGPADRPPGLVVPLRRDAASRAARTVVGLRSARDADREQALKRGGAALAKATGRWARTLRSGR